MTFWVWNRIWIWDNRFLNVFVKQQKLENFVKKLVRKIFLMFRIETKFLETGFGGFEPLNYLVFLYPNAYSICDLIDR